MPHYHPIFPVSQLCDNIWDVFICETRFILKELFIGRYQLLNTVATRYDAMNKYTISNRLTYFSELLD
jgi:hypothetical protein